MTSPTPETHQHRWQLATVHSKPGYMMEIYLYCECGECKKVLV